MQDDPDRLWTDTPAAGDLIDRREATGSLTDRQAALLRRWRSDGWLALDRPASRDRCEAALLAVEQMFAGACAAARFDCPAVGSTSMRWHPGIAPEPAVALDPHRTSPPIRDIFLHDPMAELPRLLLQRPLLLAASRAWLRPPIAADAGPPCRGGLSVWIALEAVTDVVVWTNGAAASPALSFGRGDAVLLRGSHCIAPPALPPLATARGVAACLRAAPVPTADDAGGRQRSTAGGMAPAVSRPVRP